MRSPASLVSPRVRVALAATGASLLALAAPGTAPAQPTPVVPAAMPAAVMPAARPFAAGERATYRVQYGAMRVGTAVLEVPGVDTVRGRAAYRAVFRVNGGPPFFRVDDRFESWMAVDDLASLRFHQTQHEGSKRRLRRYELYPERVSYDDLGDAAGEQPSVPRALDDGGMLLVVRTLPLRPGETYEIAQYFKPDRNPVRVHVLRRERVTVPAGTFDAVVVQPTLRSKGLFAEGGRAEVWLSDDARRVVLQVRTQLRVGTLSMQLGQYAAGDGHAPPAGVRAVAVSAP